MDIKETLNNYDLDNITIGVLGGHSALDVCRGAKKLGFRTVAVCQRGRDQTYSKYFRTREGKGIIDEVILVNKFADIVNPEVQERLRELNTIFIHNRYFWVYCNFEQIENDFNVPIYGTRKMLKLEERHIEKNQYHILQKATIRIPKIFENPKEINRLVIVKVNEAIRGYERAFFYAIDYNDYQRKSQELMYKGIITQEALSKAVIEEFIVGAQINFNFFYSPLTKELELMGTDMRRQTNIDGLIRLPASEQLEINTKPTLIETGHVNCTVKESLLEKAFQAGENFVTATKEECPPGIIGPFALQGAIDSQQGKEEFVVFDVSMRIPGSPGTRFTPYTGYLYGESISYGERIAREIKTALARKELDKIVT
jgi:5-formaminoimidazole-4-carboxamide-1-(beta)-D-ribofuranosyl 5'-monophosphate synthetase